MKKLIKEHLLSFILITLGAVLAAFSLEAFLIPCTILDGGVTGVSMILNKLTSVPISVFVFVLNLPFLFIGFKMLGKGFFARGAYGMAMFSILLEVFHGVSSITESELLAVVFGGLILGAGVGVVLRYGGCLDGSEIVALIVSKKTSFSTGQIILAINIVIYAVAGILFGWDRAMYSLLTYFITFKIIDMVEQGLEQAKAVMIITDEGRDVADEIYRRLGRTCTLLEGEGLVSGKKVVLYCVVTRVEMSEIKRIIHASDESAFVTVTEVSEIIGHHIKRRDESVVA